MISLRKEVLSLMLALCCLLCVSGFACAEETGASKSGDSRIAENSETPNGTDSADAETAEVEDVSVYAENEYMQAAIQEALEGITNGHGGPFGSVIVKDGEIVGRDHNRVLLNHDPSGHGEIQAIRDAGSNLESHDLSGCELYTTGAPCPMCLFACFWANIDKVYYGCTIEDNESIGFRDAEYESMLDATKLPEDYLVCIDRDACLKLFEVYLSLPREHY